MEYAMPLVDDLLAELERYLWLCSLDAATRFWAVLMTRLSRQISAFVCALGHFAWLRMPFGLKNAPMIYQGSFKEPSWSFRPIRTRCVGSYDDAAPQKCGPHEIRHRLVVSIWMGSTGDPD
ncbi:hypothetical protein PC114_g14765 [Phytophthora cactorum]|nr:hypothetical protein PC114_g14765 [Phytophthora cactorum]